MHLVPKDTEKLLLHYAGTVAGERKARGLKLNYPEAVAYISRAMLEGARDGRTVAELVEEGGRLLAKKDCLEGVAELITNVQVEATFPDGTKLISITDPVK